MNTPPTDSSICFLGDFACPQGLARRVSDWTVPASGFVVVNFEGAFPEHESDDATRKRGMRLYNSRESLDILKRWNVKVASLANNHLLDANPVPSMTRELLQQQGIGTCGGGDTLAQAAAPCSTTHGDHALILLAFGWRTIGCRPASERRAGTNPLVHPHVIESIEAQRQQFPTAKIVALMHWDYELEIYPLPAQRQLAFDAIRAGADIVVGHHPHCVQGIEMFQECPIVYSLGNWFIPRGNHFGYHLGYPEFANEQLAFQWDPDGGESICHWYQYDAETHGLSHTQSERLNESRRAAELTPFNGMSHSRYTSWFRQHRRQKKMLPVFTDFKPTFQNFLFNRWIELRHQAVEFRSWVRNASNRKT